MAVLSEAPAAAAGSRHATVSSRARAEACRGRMPALCDAFHKKGAALQHASAVAGGAIARGAPPIRRAADATTGHLHGGCTCRPGSLCRLEMALTRRPRRLQAGS